MNGVPYGYCHCGCGQKTQISTFNRPKKGYVKGEPKMFLCGHWWKPPMETRFWTKVNKTDSCWIWTANRNIGGYGIFKLNGKMVISSRLSWILTHGEIPEGLMVLHKCDNPSCVNPDHLFLGTSSDNMIDMHNKNRHDNSGAKNGRSKISEADVVAIRSDTRSGSKIALDYGLSISTIARIKNKTIWGHL